MSSPLPALILASGSPYRRKLLEQLQLPFQTMAPDIDESACTGEDPAALAGRLADTKAAAIAAKAGAGFIIGSDQTAALGSRILGKPGSAAAQMEQLSACSGQSVTFYTGLCLLNAASGERQSAVETTEVCFRTLSDAEIERYVTREPAPDCAGGFKVEGLGISLFRHVRSDDPGILVGLPLIRLCAFLRQTGFEIP